MSFIFLLLQETISQIYTHSMATIGYSRVLSRGGGPGSTDLVPYYVNWGWGFWPANCSELCAYQSTGQGIIDSNGPGATYYSKCYEGTTVSPLNNRRLAFASQLGTVGIDPSLPSINAQNHSCRRIDF